MTKKRTFTVDDLLRLPRLSSLALSPDGTRLIVSAARPDGKGKKLVSTLHELDPTGGEPPHRLTRSASSESGAAFAPDGSLLFLSSRPDPSAEPDSDNNGKTALWRLPAGAGEAQPLVSPPGGVDSFAVARDSGAIVIGAGSYPDSENEEQDAGREKARKDAGVGAQLFEEYPFRFWDHYLGPRERHLRLVQIPGDDSPAGAGEDLTPSPGRSLDFSSFDITPDGSTVVATRLREEKEKRERFEELISVDTASGETRVLAGDEASYSSPACSPDGRHAVAVRWGLSAPDDPADMTLRLVDLETGEGRDLLGGFDRWPRGPLWGHDSEAIFFTADEDGHAPVLRVDLETRAVTRLTSEGVYSDLCLSHDGHTLHALRSTVAEPPHPVELDAGSVEAESRRLRNFAELADLELDAQVERITTTAVDGSHIRSWLVLPPGASSEEPTPLATFIHGGPLSTWSGWHWRWNPHVFIEEGWAVLLPDPALSTGYGMETIRRGWGKWGEVVYDDLMRVVDEVVGREDIDAEHTVAMGGSFGGYMSNWISGHTDRFDAIVTHASVWDLDSFHGETDLGWWWEREFGDPYRDGSRYRENSPRRHVINIKTPMLVIHGELDYRVAIGEGLRLWTDLKRNGVEAKFLYFPDENHWIMKPNNIKIWYQTVLNFIDHYSRGQKWKRPELL